MKSRFYSVWGLLFFCVAVFFLLFWIARPNWEISGDGHGYYMYARSLYFDGDFDFENEYVRYDTLYGTDLTKGVKQETGRHGNPFAIGKSILYMPFSLVAVGLNDFLEILTPDIPGFSSEFQIFLGIGTLFYVLVGVFFLFKALSIFFEKRSSWFGVVTVVFASPLLHYIIYEPHMSHGVSFAATSILFYCTALIFKQREMSMKSGVVLGIVMGFAMLVRWQNMIFFVVPFFVLVMLWREKKVRLLEVLQPFMIAFLCLIPQLMMWHHLYGFWLGVPQGSSFIDFSNPHIFNVLFSPYHGLFIWHPLLALGLIGLFLSWKKRKVLFWGLVTALFFQIYLNASLADWWGGSAFGARKMIGALFVFAYGFAYVLERIEKKMFVQYILIACICIATVWNGFFMLSAARGNISLGEPVSYTDVYTAPPKYFK